MMKMRAMTWAAVGILGTCASAPAEDGLLRTRAVHPLPAYAEAAATTDAEDYSGEAAYKAAREDKEFVFERLVYESDGLAVVAYLMRRADGRARPGVVFNRGSYVRNDAAPELLVLMHRMAREGFAVLAPMYRGSEGAEGHDEMGGADVAELMATARLTREIDEIDAGTLYLYGESRGGMMVYQAIRDGFPARAAAVFGGFTDLERLMASDPERYEEIKKVIWPDFEKNRAAILKRRSALRFADDLTMPILIMHGGRDRSVHLSHALDMAAALAEGERDFKLTVFGDDGHILSGHAAGRDALAASWFKEHR